MPQEAKIVYTRSTTKKESQYMGVRDKSRDTDALYQIAKELLQIEEYEQMLDVLMRAALPLLGADRGFLVLIHNGALRYQVLKNWSQEELLSEKELISRSILSEVLRGTEPILVEDALQDTRFQTEESIRAMTIRSVLAAPLLADGKAVGALYLESRNIKRFFGQEELSLFKEMLLLANRILSLASRRIILEQRNRLLENDFLARYQFPGIVTRSSAFLRVLEIAAQVATSSLPVLIQGPSGTGKELLARAIHINSDRAKRPFITINCGAISPNLLESELFGYVKGAFTGAIQNKEGLIAAAHEGTLFLDEVGELPKELQVKLLRTLQFGEVQPVGATRTQHYQVRFLAATNRDLAAEVKRGLFREDLLFRLNAITLSLPPLKDRPEDILPIFYHFLQKACEAEKRPRPEVSPKVERVLQEYEWPGNVRELENETRRLIALTPAGLPLTVDRLSQRVNTRPSPPPLSSLGMVEQERELIEMHLKLAGGNRTQAAKSLGITREGLRKKMKRFNVQG